MDILGEGAMKMPERTEGEVQEALLAQKGLVLATGLWVEWKVMALSRREGWWGSGDFSHSLYFEHSFHDK